jgi:hypothetical protein
MSIYTVVVSGRPVMTFSFEWPVDVAQMALEEHGNGLRIFLEEHIDPDGRRLLENGDTLSVRFAGHDELRRHGSAIEAVRASYRSEGWEDFEPDEVVGTLVPVKPIDWDEDVH